MLEGPDNPEGHGELLPLGKLARSTISFKTVTLAAQTLNLVQLDMDNAFSAFLPLSSQFQKYLFSITLPLWKSKKTKYASPKQ